jgi:hypothetical protein
VPVIRGTRFPPSQALLSLSAGYSIKEVEEDYNITDEDLRAAFLLAGLALEEGLEKPFKDYHVDALIREIREKRKRRGR